MKIQFLGKTRPIYRGMNSVTNASIQLAAGQEIELSDEQAERLLKDYPKDFEQAGEVPTIAPEPESEIPMKEPEPAKAKKTKEPKAPVKKSKKKKAK
jgi:hypothetical protein